MDLAALSLCIITTQARCRTLQPGVEWNARSIHCGMLVAVNNTTCQVIKLAQYGHEIVAIYMNGQDLKYNHSHTFHRTQRL